MLTTDEARWVLTLDNDAYLPHNLRNLCWGKKVAEISASEGFKAESGGLV